LTRLGPRTRTTYYASAGRGGYFRERYAYECANWDLNITNGLYDTHYCVDYHGQPYSDTAFQVVHYTFDPPRVDGYSACSGFTWPYRYEMVVPWAWGNNSYGGYTECTNSLWANNLIPDAAMATDAIAKSNPSKPTVDLPLLVWELRELPQLIRWTGERLLSRKTSGAYLAWSFGAAPLIGDLLKLLEFQLHVERRIKVLDRLFSGQGISRDVTLSKWTVNESGTYGDTGPSWYISYNNGAAASMKGKINWTNSSRSWANVKWTPTAGYPRQSHPDRLNAIRLVLGLNPSLSTVWNAVPWTWLTDWFINIGDYLAATNNILGLTHSAVNVMCETKVDVEYVVTLKPSIVTVHDQSGTSFVMKRRDVFSGPSVSASIPFLTGRQWSILGALAIQRMPRSLLRL